MPGQGCLDAQLAGLAARFRPAVIVHDHRLDAKERATGTARLERVSARQRRDQNAARFRLPPRVDDRAALLADVPPVPQPHFGIDRLAHRTQQLEAGQVARS